MLMTIDRDTTIVKSAMNVLKRKSKELDNVTGRMVELNHSNRTYEKSRIDYIAVNSIRNANN